MSISIFLKRNLGSFNRFQQKKRVISTILEQPQLNQSVINVHRIDENNIGDFYCAPHLYFDKLKGKKLDIFDYKSNDKAVIDNWMDKVSNNALIIGGGGLLNRSSFQKQIRLFEQLSTKGKKTVLWGVGHNSQDIKDFNKISNYNIDTGKFGLVGVRDFNMNEKWVPCVSCMHSIFDKPFEETHDIGIIYHKKTIKNKKLLKKLSNYPFTSNTTDLDSMVDFIGTSRTIVTDSYHAMYWSMLLGKNTIVIPNSSKFFDFKYKPVISTFDDFEKDLNKAQPYSGVLEECRSINSKFAEKVFDYLNL